jgi:hypothetical protein
MLRRNLSAFLILLFLVLTLLIVCKSGQGDEENEAALEVSLVTYSNSMGGSRFAIVGVTNHDSVQLAIGDIDRIELRNQKLPSKGHSSLVGTNLFPGCGCRVTLQLPTEAGDWRASWWVTRLTLKQRLTHRLKAYRDLQLGTRGDHKFWYDWLDNYYGEPFRSAWM